MFKICMISLVVVVVWMALAFFGWRLARYREKMEDDDEVCIYSPPDMGGGL